MLYKTILGMAAVGAVSAQRPSATPICDYYTTALLKNNTAENQLTLLTLVVNTVVIGNYTQPNVGIAVPGILAPGQYNGTDVNLLPYFNGQLLSSNRGGDSGVSINFLDSGGAEPLKQNKPANSDSSNQYFLLTHLYQFFGALLGCSQYGMGAFPAYEGHGSMYEVHRFMDLDQNEVGYFIQQVALAAASFGVAQDDLMVVGTALNSLFNVRCAPPTTVIPAQGSLLQSICIADTCPLSPNATCSQYMPAKMPGMASNTSMTATPSSSSAATVTAKGSSTATVVMANDASAPKLSMGALAGGLLAALLL